MIKMQKHVGLINMSYRLSVRVTSGRLMFGRIQNTRLNNQLKPSDFIFNLSKEL